MGLRFFRLILWVDTWLSPRDFPGHVAISTIWPRLPRILNGVELEMKERWTSTDDPDYSWVMREEFTPAEASQTITQ